MIISLRSRSLFPSGRNPASRDSQPTAQRRGCFQRTEAVPSFPGVLEDLAQLWIVPEDAWVWFTELLEDFSRPEMERVNSYHLVVQLFGHETPCFPRQYPIISLRYLY